MAETTRTGPHREFEKLLDSYGISYQSECKDFPPYQLDVYLGEWHLCVEIDGLGHHRRTDAARDKELLERYEIPTLRIPGTMNRDGRRKELMAFIGEHSETAQERLQRWQTRRSRPHSSG